MADIKFGTLTPQGLTNVRIIKQSAIGKCPHVIMVAEHYRTDGSCKCDDAKHRAYMIDHWEYTADDFPFPVRVDVTQPDN